MDKIKALQYFKRVAELGSFSQTAAELNIPTSSISRRIKDLEKVLNIELFKRTTRNVNLTEAGSIYYAQISQVLSLLEEADEAIGLQSEAPQGFIKISTTPGYGDIVLLPILQQFQQQYPLINFDLNFSDDLVTLGKDPIDIAIRAGYAPNEFVIAKQLSENNFTLVSTPKLYESLKLRHKRDLFSIANLRDSPCLVYRTAKGALPWWANVDDKWQKIRLKPILITNSGKYLLDEALKDKGLLLFPDWSIKPYLESGELVKVETDFQLSISNKTGNGIFMLYQKQKYAFSKVNLCVNYIIDKLG